MKTVRGFRFEIFEMISESFIAYSINRDIPLKERKRDE